MTPTHNVLIAGAGKAVGLLDDCSRQAITSLQAQGDAQAAVRVLVDRTSTSLNEMVKPQGPWDRFVQQFSDRNARTLDQTHRHLEAAQAAENSRNEAIAQSTRTALDALRATSDRAALSGLSPYDRIIRENDQRFRDLQERTINGPLANGTAIALLGSAPVGTSPGFNGALQRTLGFEGGLNPRDTNGTPSNMGINAAANPGVDIGSLTPSGATAIYKKNYWDAIGADSMSPQMARVAFDTAVMQGVGRAMKEVTASGGDASRMMDLREGFESSLLNKNPAKYGPYAKAWANRDAGLRADIDGGGPAAGTAVLDPTAAGLANRANCAVGRKDDVTNLLMRGPTQSELQIGGQSRMFATQRDTLGQSASGIAAATERQREWNEVTAAGVTQQKLMTNFGAAGAKMWGELSDKINANAAAAGRLAQQQQDEQNRQQLMSAVGNDAADVFSSATIGGLTGKGFGNSAKSALYGIGEQLIHSGFSSLFGGLFGGGKGGGGGLLESLFSGHMFAGGTNDAPEGPSIVGEKGPELVNLPAHAQVIPNSALASMRAPSVQMGDTHVHIHSVGGAQFTDQQILQINGQVAQGVQQGNQQVIDHMTRSLPQIQADAQQFA